MFNSTILTLSVGEDAYALVDVRNDYMTIHGKGQIPSRKLKLRA